MNQKKSKQEEQLHFHKYQSIIFLASNSIWTMKNNGHLNWKNKHLADLLNKNDKCIYSDRTFRH